MAPKKATPASQQRPITSFFAASALTRKAAEGDVGAAPIDGRLTGDGRYGH